VISRRSFLRAGIIGSALGGGAVLIGRQLTGYSLDAEVGAKLRAFSAKEFLIMQAIARRLLAADERGKQDAPSAEHVGVALFVDSYVARLPVAIANEVRTLLHLVEHGGVLFRLRPTRFTRMVEAEQDATLADWQDSRLSARRRGFQALRTLAFLGYYRDARAWPLVGYSGPVRLP
jgi:hypothetical protein